MRVLDGSQDPPYTSRRLYNQSTGILVSSMNGFLTWIRYSYGLPSILCSDFFMLPVSALFPRYFLLKYFIFDSSIGTIFCCCRCVVVYLINSLSLHQWNQNKEGKLGSTTETRCTTTQLIYPFLTKCASTVHVHKRDTPGVTGYLLLLLTLSRTLLSLVAYQYETMCFTKLSTPNPSLCLEIN